MKTSLTILALVIGAPLMAGIGLAATASAVRSNPLQVAHGDAPLNPLRHALRGIAPTILRHVLNAQAEAPLTAAQKEQIRSIIQSHQAEIKNQVIQGRDARRAMHDTAMKSGPDSAATRQAAEKLGTATRDGALLMARLGSAVRPVLKPEQVERWQKAREQIDAAVDEAIGSVGQ